MDMFQLAEQMAKNSSITPSKQSSIKITDPVKIKPKLVMPPIEGLLTNTDLSLTLNKAELPNNQLEANSTVPGESPKPKNKHNFKVPPLVWWGIGLSALGAGIYVGVKEYKKYKIRKEIKNKEKTY